MLFMTLAKFEELIREFGDNRDLIWSESEQARLDRYKTDTQRARFIAGHGLARVVLQQCLGGKIGAWRLNSRSGEPPTVVDHPELSLSITHSDQWFACALSDQPVGIDLEVLKPTRDVLALAEIVCNREERNQLSRLNAQEQQLLFLRLWTLKEARLKQEGTGLDFKRMQQLALIPAIEQSPQAISWFDPASGLTLALTSPCIDTMQPVWPDGLTLQETGRWRFSVVQTE